MFTVLTNNQPKQYVCGWNGERLTRVVCGNIIDYTHAYGKHCTHTKVQLLEEYAVKDAR